MITNILFLEPSIEYHRRQRKAIESHRRSQKAMESSGKYHGISLNIIEYGTESHGRSWNVTESHGIFLENSSF